MDGLIEVLLDVTQGFETVLTRSRLIGWQAALFPKGYSGFHFVKTGDLHGEEPMHVVSLQKGQEHIHFTAPNREILDEQVDSFLAWFNAVPTIDGLLRAGLAHLWFITLHPFEDGNGRLARAISDMAMAAEERQPMRVFSLSAQILLERDGYYGVLEKTQRGDLDVTAWLLWFLEQVRCAAGNAENTFRTTIAKAKFWMRHQGPSISDRQRKVLHRLLDAGPNGFTSGMNTRKYMSLTKTSRATAYRELTMLVEQGCLVQRSAGGRSTAYDIAW